MTDVAKLEFKVHFRNGKKGKRRLKRGKSPEAPVGEAVSRIARLMALAIHFDQLIRDGVVEDYADLARLGKVSRARITQVMDLLNLAPDVQESLLHSESRNEGYTGHICSERNMRVVCTHADWETQRELFSARMQNTC